MKQRIKKYKKYIQILILVTILSLTYCGVKYLKQPKYEELPKVNLKDIKSSKSFAIMITNDGNNYYEYENDNWPGADYAFKEAKCTDNNGALVENAITFEKETVILETDQTVYCTLYFFGIPEIVKQLREKDKDVSDGIEHISSDLQGGMYRYQGTDNVANWICFGTNDLSECTDETDSDGNNISDGIDKYMYRIIGITPNGELYLIKETFVKEGETPGFSWNDEYQITGSGVDMCSNGKCPEWNEADLFQRINGTANGSTPGKGDNNDKKDNDTDIFVDSEYYDYLKSGDNDGINGSDTSSEWYNLIADHEWLYGDTTETKYDGNEMYAIETGKVETTHYVQKPEGSSTIELQTYNWPETNKVTAKISLMYMHDVLYAYPEGKPGSDTNIKNSWIHFQKDGYNLTRTYEWLSTRWNIVSMNTMDVGARRVGSSGSMGYGRLYGGDCVRPVFYLSPNAKIKSGNGTKSDPFILDVQA